MGGEASCSGGRRIIECRLPNVELVDYLVWHGLRSFYNKTYYIYGSQKQP